MKVETETIQQELAQLANERRVGETLWELARELAAYTNLRAVKQGVEPRDEAADNAAEFLVFLSGRSSASLSTIKSKSDLGREFKKWVTHRQAPAAKELWTVLSEALLALEKAGKVKRTAKFRARNNSNTTRWHASPFEGRAARRLEDGQVLASKPKLSAKGEKDRVLAPTEAAAWVMALLDMAKGELAMGDLVAMIRPHMQLFATVGLDDQGSDEDDGVCKWQERVASADVSPYLELRINEDIEYAVENIWTRVGTIKRGVAAAFEGHRILCCYWIPKKVFDQKITLEEFGSSSTVNDVARDITGVMAEYVPVPDGGDDDREQSACRRVAAGIVGGLSKRCSEIGYCPAFMEE